MVQGTGVWLLLLAIILGGSGCCRLEEGAGSRTSAAALSDPVRIVLVRHAENSGDALTEAGWERAAHLAAMFEQGGVTHLYASDRVRAQETLKPLADRTALPVAVLPAADHAGWMETLTALPPGALAVVAGHSNTVPALVRDLGGSPDGLDDTGNLPHDTYDRVFVVVRGEGVPTAFLELRMGPH